MNGGHPFKNVRHIIADINGNIWLGFLETVQGLVSVFESAGNTRTIMFCALVGALIIFIQRSGGVEGFILKVQKLLDKYETKKSGNARVIVQLLAWLTGVLIFVESANRKYLALIV